MFIAIYEPEVARFAKRTYFVPVNKAVSSSDRLIMHAIPAIPIPNDFLTAAKQLYDVAGYSYTNPVMDKEGVAYGSGSFILENKLVLFRIANTTPSKTGQFVTLWKRSGEGPIAPIDSTDTFDLVVISCRHQQYFGQFIFSGEILLKQGILSHFGKGGKRGFRVYPPWDHPESTQALKTRQWQSEFFLPIPENGLVDLQHCHKLIHDFPFHTKK